MQSSFSSCMQQENRNKFTFPSYHYDYKRQSENDVRWDILYENRILFRTRSFRCRPPTEKIVGLKRVIGRWRRNEWKIWICARIDDDSSWFILNWMVVGARFGVADGIHLLWYLEYKDAKLKANPTPHQSGSSFRHTPLSHGKHPTTPTFILIYICIVRMYM